MSNLSKLEREALHDFFVDALSIIPNYQIQENWQTIQQVAQIIDIDYEDFYNLTGFKFGQFDEQNYIDDRDDQLFFSQYI